MPAADYFVGTDVNDVINVDFGTLSGIASYTSTALGLTATGAADVATVTAAQGAMAAVDNAIDNISEARATAGALISRFEFRGQQIATSLENIDAVTSSIMEVDLAAAPSKLETGRAAGREKECKEV